MANYVMFRGRRACICLATWLPVYEAELLRLGLIKRNIDIYQLIGGYVKSGGTHATGGAADLAQYTTAQLRVARDMGADADWHRGPPSFMHHAHLVLRNCPHNGPARYQITAVDAGYNGLGRGGRGGRDTGPRPLSKRTWQQGIAWAKARATKQQEDDMPTAKEFWSEDIIPSPSGSKTNPNWQVSSALGVMLKNSVKQAEDTAAMRADIAEMLKLQKAVGGGNPKA